MQGAEGPRTLPEAFQRTAAAQPDAVALRAYGSDTALTWGAYATHVRRIAGGLAALGVRRGDTLALMLTNRPEFHLAEAGASHLGATTFSVYNTSSVEQIGHLLNHTGAQVIVTERQFTKLVKAAAAGTVRHILVVEDGDLERLDPRPDFDFEATWRAVDPDDVLCLIHTSGTTGPPKAAEHTHRGALAMAADIAGAFPMRDDDIALSYLPAAHVADRFLNQYFAMLHGVEVVTLADASRLARAMAEIRPTTFAAVPRIWEKLHLGVQDMLAADPKLAAAVEAGTEPVLTTLRTRLGLGRMRWALSGAAAIAPDAYAFLQRLGVPVSEVWGMSECGLATGVPPEQARIATVGKPFPSVETKVTDGGELLIRTPFRMKGYRGDPQRTAALFDEDGWLHTGDVVTVDDDGYVRIVDRVKELIINAAGKNMSPTNIENVIISTSPLIGGVLAVGDARPYNVALIALEPATAAARAAQFGLDPDPALLAVDERIVAEVQAGVDAGNTRLSRVEQIKRFAVLPSYWLPGGDELTPTMKLKRRPIQVKYAAEIAELYAAER
ncbi:AMP-binding protein [Streptomyces boluensis]|uniref:AMP-binding protein n=1 Tax=Streptomyces boluensis TaxID=1775135 RepID=A0A964V0X3_9ACTN|nr:AMP-binding protein [Streptomyces boluensis]NBE56552.1 AMP-binding protein [Streptomyces boluensis]